MNWNRVKSKRAKFYLVEEKGLLASVIVKLVYFVIKPYICGSKVSQRTKKNEKKNQKKFYVRERLPAIDAYIEKLAEGMKLISSTNNCTVSVLWDRDGIKEVLKINDFTELENVKNCLKNIREQNPRPVQITGFRKPKLPLRLTDNDPDNRLLALDSQD